MTDADRAQLLAWPEPSDARADTLRAELAEVDDHLVTIARQRAPLSAKQLVKDASPARVWVIVDRRNGRSSGNSTDCALSVPEGFFLKAR